MRPTSGPGSLMGERGRLLGRKGGCKPGGWERRAQACRMGFGMQDAPGPTEPSSINQIN